jgi:hypothetical protein
LIYSLASYWSEIQFTNDNALSSGSSHKRAEQQPDQFFIIVTAHKLSRTNRCTKKLNIQSIQRSTYVAVTNTHRQTANEDRLWQYCHLPLVKQTEYARMSVYEGLQVMKSMHQSPDDTQ